MRQANLRNIDEELYKEVRAEAIRQGITIGEYTNQAYRLKLKADKKNQEKTKKGG